jgi:K+-transporting ATPase c subunit
MKVTSSLRNSLVILACMLLAVIAWYIIKGWQSDDFVIQDEKAVAVAALAEKFAGPRYFQHTSDDPVNPPGSGEVGIFITTTSASRQVHGIIEERHLNPETAAKLHRLIDKLTEPPPSRLFSERINLVRLNLALDALQ